MQGVMVPRKLWPGSSKAVILWWRRPHIIPYQLQNWIESFHELKIPCGSLSMDFLNSSKAKRSETFVGVAKEVAGCKHNRVIVKSRIMWRYVEHNAGKLGLWSFIGLDKQKPGEIFVWGSARNRSLYFINGVDVNCTLKLRRYTRLG